MRNYLAAGVVLGLLAGCSSHQDQAVVGAAAEAAADSPLAGDAGLLFTSRAPMSGLASLPDRGELLAYEKSRQVKHKAAYTAYPVAISEAHALNAMRTGEMVINAPNGEQVRLTYERHEEGKDGNWTWIGRNADGASAVITFGEKAVFGVIPQGATETLRLTMSAGQPWLVQTDRSRLAGMGGEPRREGGDQLIPPKLASAAAAKAATSASSMQDAPTTAGASASAAVVDVLLGYTPGFVTQIGQGESGAITRLVNMVAITNDAYANSGVNMRVRLVKTLKVNYADNTDNGDALEKLTGYESGDNGGPKTPDPAFDELRSTRDEVGADLVSLVRAFSTPENNGCGIAWLLGSGGEEIDATRDAEFGYSIVSDGTDLDEDDGNTYFCRDETLAHEMGHNMGQAHNQEDSSGTGTHSYSYGYRESSSSGFYTVMAYPQADGDQFSIRYFANPSVKYQSRATGVANKSDNAKSMNLSMPIVSQFRSTVVPLQGVKSDFNGDGKSDVLWRNAGSGKNIYWNGAGYNDLKTLQQVIGSAWVVAGIGDFAGDGKADVLWWNKSSDKVVLWPNASYSARQALGTVDYGSWVVAGIGDLTGDGKDDIVWRNTKTGSNVYWKSGSREGANKVSLQAINDQGWKIAGVGDFDGDGRADILWRNETSGRNLYWKGGAYSSRTELHPIAGAAWRVAGIGDFNGDGKSDVLWRNSSSGKNMYWESADYGARVSLQVVAGSTWLIEQVADFNGDGRADILWRKSATGANMYWSGGDYGARKQLHVIEGNAWKIVP